MKRVLFDNPGEVVKSLDRRRGAKTESDIGGGDSVGHGGNQGSRVVGHTDLARTILICRGRLEGEIAQHAADAGVVEEIRSEDVGFGKNGILGLQVVVAMAV